MSSVFDENPYEVLGVSKTATQAKIKSAYRALAQKHHPDKPTGDAERFKDITEAYEILSDDDKRQIYDQQGNAGLRVAQEKAQKSRFDHLRANGDVPDNSNTSAPNPGTHINNPPAFNQSWKVAKDNQLFNDLFTNFFKTAAEKHPENNNENWVSGFPMIYPLSLTLKEMFTGCKKVIKYSRNKVCPNCYGKGYKPRSKTNNCESCKGSGLTKTLIGSADCRDCYGRGQIYQPEDVCLACDGSRIQVIDSQIEVDIKPGMNDKIKLRYENMGHEEMGKTPGDLIVELMVCDLGQYEVDGADLKIKLPITLAEALSGSVAKDIKYVDGSLIRIMTEPNLIVQPGEVKIYRGSGMPIYDESNPNSKKIKKGDLKVEFQLSLPKVLPPHIQKQVCSLLAPYNR
jgi:DnaJ-class molecular chaperone